MKTKSIITLLLGLCLGMALGIFFKDRIVGVISPSSQGYGGSKFQWTIDLIEKKYVDQINIDSILDGLVPQIISQLDPHSEYIDPKIIDAVNEGIEGKFEGIGVVFNMATDTAIVLSVISGGPGAKAGVEPGDRIITVNDTTIAGVKANQFDVVGKLRGKKGTTVNIGVQRGKNPDLIDFTLTRDVIPINSVEAQFLNRDSAAYIKINTFADHTYVDAISAINTLVKDGAHSVVIDLRGNGGGRLDQALLLANEFLASGQKIVYIEGEHFARSEQTANGKGAFQNIPLYVIIDESSASASEIFAGAIQDNDRGTIIGRRSFGKGLVQEQIPYKDGSAARITVARYYTPIGRPVQKPYTAGDSDSYDKELLERFEGGEVSTGVNLSADTSKKYVTKGGKVLYGGGGITPDEFVKIDTSEKFPTYFETVYINNAIFPYAQIYADANRKEINSIGSVRELDKFFESRPNLYNDFIAYAASKHGVKRPSAKEKKDAEKIILAQLKAYIGRYTPLQESAFYYYTQLVDQTTERLSELMK